MHQGYVLSIQRHHTYLRCAREFLQTHKSHKHKIHMIVYMCKCKQTLNLVGALPQQHGVFARIEKDVMATRSGSLIVTYSP